MNADNVMHATIESVLNSGKTYSFEEIDLLMFSELAGYAGRRDPTLRGNQDIAKMYLVIGEAGIGKTSFWKQFAIKYKIPMRMINFGEVEVEDNLGIPKAAEGSVYHEVQAPPGFPVLPPERDVSCDYDVLPGRSLRDSAFVGKGIVLFNEVATANPKQESQLRSAISERKIGHNRIADGWLLVADSNPMDTKYTTVNRMDYSLESRLLPLPVRASYETAMTYWAKSGTLSKTIYHFLEAKKVPMWERADNRRWVSVGDSVQAMVENNVDIELISKFLETAIGVGVGPEFMAFLRFGNDPEYYPIMATDILEATAEENKKHVALIKRWSKDAERGGLIASTGAILSRYFSGDEYNFATSARGEENMKAILPLLPADSVSNIITGCGPKTAGILRSFIAGTELDKKIVSMHRKHVKEASK